MKFKYADKFHKFLHEKILYENVQLIVLINDIWRTISIGK